MKTTVLFYCIYLYFLIPVVVSQNFNHTAEITISTEIPTEKAKADIEKHPVHVKAKINQCSI